MRTLSAAVTKTSGKVDTPSAWLLLVDITIGATTIHMVDNSENIVFNGNTYTASNLAIGAAHEAGDGQIISWDININDVSRILAPSLENYNGAIGDTVTITVVNSKLLADNYASLVRTFTIRAAAVSGDQITLSLGGTNLLLSRSPHYRYMGLHCNWIFKTAECGYVGGIATCDRTWAQCLARSNTPRFGGFLPLRSGTIRYAW